MTRAGKALSATSIALGVTFMLSASDQTTHAQQRGGASAPAAGGNAPSSIPMGGNKSVTRFFVTSKGLGKGGDLGGLAGADAHCQALAQAQGAGDHTWRAYLSTEALGSFCIGLTKAIVFQRFKALPSDTLVRGLIVGATLMVGSRLAKGLVLRLDAGQFRTLLDCLLAGAGLVLLWGALVLPG